MSPLVKTLLIFSLTLNLFFSIQFLRSTSEPGSPEASSDISGTATEDGQTPRQEESLVSKVFGGSNSELEKKVEQEFFPKVRGALSKRFPSVVPVSTSVRDDEIIVTMSPPDGGEAQKDAARAMVVGVLDAWKETESDLKNRNSTVRFSNDR